ncbi:hypothetical protein PISMIDRAFT_103770 [Pisolithus microcarpus 441]|uniref:Unplaced genomic scaffold scaffold_65, whole genome shotgun sequence n=1 Tax=Pisolithus microcarpus 441 TaxID=765257 RepID=A0A0C9Z6C9_9AGAM|nr:hypothetical protein PISMIDRAFT_103770 [Pisolithus microcarpus 441]
MKIWSDIIQVWKDYFAILKIDLVVPGHFTMDNVENNVTMMTHLGQLLLPHELPLGFDAKDRHIMCYTHIMNICVQHVIDAFCSPDFTVLAEAWDDAFDDGEVDKDEYLAAVQRDLVSLGHSADIAHYRMSNMDWFILREYEILLDIPHKVQQHMSSEKRATLNHAVPSFELFMTAWEKLHETNKHIAPFIDVSLKWAKQYYNRMDNTQAYIISMLVDPSLRFRWIRKYWGQEWITHAEDIVLALMEKYRATKVSASGNIESSSQPDSLDSLARLYGLDDMELGPSTCGALQAVEQEYRLYVDGELVDKSMDPLRFWEVNCARFPMMFAIAMDYLLIQASSVPCERVFSSSTDTDMKKRNQISPILMEALQMLKYHLRSQ